MTGTAQRGDPARRDRRRGGERGGDGDVVPRLEAAGDPVLARTWWLTVGGTLLLAACVAARLASWCVEREMPPHWWQVLLVVLLAIPAVRPSAALVPAGLVVFGIVWLSVWPGVGGWLNLAVLGLHTAVTAWFLAAELPARARLHRSALRSAGLRWLWIQAVGQLAALLAWLVAGTGPSTVLAIVGCVALLALAVGAVLVARRDAPDHPARLSR